MRIAVVLGNRINDDGSFTSIMVRRLELALELYNNEMVDKIICSGGYANPSVNCSEAEKMKEYLVNKNIPEELIIEENKSLSTYQNALYSVPIALEEKANLIIVTSTNEHFTKYNYNVIKYFEDQLIGQNVRLMVYTDCEEKHEE